MDKIPTPAEIEEIGRDAAEIQYALRKWYMGICTYEQAMMLAVKLLAVNNLSYKNEQSHRLKVDWPSISIIQDAPEDWVFVVGTNLIATCTNIDTREVYQIKIAGNMLGPGNRLTPAGLHYVKQEINKAMADGSVKKS
jgi:hypothetical protein